MNAADLERKLHSEGYTRTFVAQDGPNVDYPDHTHPTDTAHIVLDGELTVTVNGQSQTFRAGDRCDRPADAVHSARIGPTGCRLLVGEK